MYGLGSADSIAAYIALGEYSPIGLRGLPQPVPRDVQDHMDRSVFGFEAAFEDLLSASHGQPLPDISDVYTLRANLRDRFPAGEPVFMFLRRLRAKGLLDAPSFKDYSKTSNPRDAVEFLHQQAEHRIVDLWRSAADLEKRPDTDDISALMKATMNAWEWKAREMAEDGEEALRALKMQPSEPDSEADFIEAIESRFGGRDMTWDTFRRSLGQDPQTQAAWHETPSHGRHTVTKRQYVDRFGMHHTTTTTKFYDEDGNQIGTKVAHTATSAGTDDSGNGPRSTD